MSVRTEDAMLRIVEEAAAHVERQLELVRSRRQTLDAFAEELEDKLRTLRRRGRELRG